MLCAEPLHVQHSSKPVLADASKLACGRNPSGVEGERGVWDYCIVSSTLSLQFFRFRDGSREDIDGDGASGSGSVCFTLSCINTGEVLKRAGALTAVRRERCMSSRTVAPHLDGSLSAHAAALLAQYCRGDGCGPTGKTGGAPGPQPQRRTIGEEKMLLDRVKSGFDKKNSEWLGYLSLSLSLPTIAVLVQCRGSSQEMVLVLRPHVHAGKSASLGYHASLTSTSELTRRLVISPCGSTLLALPDRFGVVEDPLRACEETTPLLSGQLVRLSGVESLSPLPAHVLSGAAARGEGGLQRVELLMGRELVWAHCRWGGDEKIELVLLSRCGVGLVCTEGGIAGTALGGVGLRCVRFFFCADVPGRGLASEITTAAAPRLLHSTSADDDTRPAKAAHVGLQRVVGCTPDGMVLLCAAENAPRDVTVVTATLLPSAVPGVLSPVTARLPAGFELHDVHVVSHPRFSGALLVGAAPRGSEAMEGHSVPQLHFLPFGATETTPVSTASFRQWSGLPAEFFSSSHPLRLLRVEVAADPTLSPSLLVALGSSRSPKTVATMLVTLPRGALYAREYIEGRGSVDERGVSVMVGAHVVQTMSRARLESEWRTRQRLRSPADAGRHGETLSVGWEAGPWVLEEECVHVAREALLEAQRRGAGVGVCLTCVMRVLAGIHCGVSAACTAIETTEELNFLRRLSEVAVAGMEVLQLSGSASAIQAGAALLHESVVGGAAVLSWQRLLAPVYDMAFTSTSMTPAVSALGPCSPMLQSTVALGHEWLLGEEEGRSLTIQGERYSMKTLREHAEKARPLEEVVQCVASGPASWEALTVLDIFWAARRLFLSHGAGAAVRLLQTLCESGTCAESVREMHAMYRGIEARGGACQVQIPLLEWRACHAQALP